jgi:hypothetical protein
MVLKRRLLYLIGLAFTVAAVFVASPANAALADTSSTSTGTGTDTSSTSTGTGTDTSSTSTGTGTDTSTTGGGTTVGGGGGNTAGGTYVHGPYGTTYFPDRHCWGGYQWSWRWWPWPHWAHVWNPVKTCVWV